MQTETHNLSLLPEIMDRILAVSNPEKIILFGSYAHGKGGPDSDLDLMDVIKGVQSTRAESNRLRGALRGLLAPIDIIVATPEQLERHRNTVGLIYRTVLSKGKTLYERPAAS
jgi:predicted nucleotidyltransferase